MNFFAWIIVGGVAGWLATLFMKKDKDYGIFANIIIGVLGAVIGGFLLSLVGGPGVTGINLTSILVALLGAVILVGIVQIVKSRT